MTEHTGNKGEWSELYALLRLLADGKLYAADAETNKIATMYYDILEAIRKQTNGGWTYKRGGEIKVINAETEEVVVSIPIADFKEQADTLLYAIKDTRRDSATFEVPEAWKFAEKIKCNTIKAPSTDKSDITLVVHDIRTGMNPLLRFSIKSQLGSPSTLLNPSAATNFLYRIVGHKLSDVEKAKFISFRKFKERFQYLKSLGRSIEFKTIRSSVFAFNMQLVDTQLPIIMSELLKEFYFGNAVKIHELTKLIEDKNTFGFTGEEKKVFYSYKVKELLTNIALGMVPATRWAGKYDATGGYIIVKEDGDVLCYHIYNRNEFREYLFTHTKLDTPSTSRYKFGFIFDEADGQYIDLNLQIRFLK